MNQVEEWKQFAARHPNHKIGLDMLTPILEFDLAAKRRLDELEARIKALEAKPSGKGVKWAGVWGPDKAYVEGNLATKAGSLWLAVRDTNAAPGEPGSGWRLVCKGQR